MPFPIARLFLIARRCLSRLTLLLATWLAATACAQPVTAPLPERWVRPQLVVATQGMAPIRLQQVSVRTQVSGSLAITEVAMVFHNPNRQVLEGELQFPLLDGQTLLGFALDIDGRLREAVPVDKARGQAVFEDVIRERVDPALLEVTRGNNFKLRVYPIPPQGTRQVVLRYAETLRDRAGRHVYRLPLEFADALDAFNLEVGVNGVRSAPVVARGPLDGLAFERSGAGYRAQLARERFAGRGMLEIELAPVPGPVAFTQLYEGKTYFHAHVPVPVPVREAARSVPNSVALVWDSSGSGAARDHAREFALLDAYFRRMRNGEVRLTRVRDVAEPVQRFRIVDGDWRLLRAALEATPYDGATNLGAVSLDSAAREYLLFTDGLSNFGERAFPVTGVPVYTVSSATKANPVLLRQLAEASGGRHVDLSIESAAGAAHRLLTATTRVIAVAADGATQLVLPSPYPERNRIAIAGELTASATLLRLTIADPGPDAAVRTIEVPVRAGEAPFDLAAPLWARYRIEALEAHYDLNRAEIRRLGQAFRLPTRETSLIVLDRVEDYARHDIVPPPELLADWQRLRQGAQRAVADDRNRHLEQVVARFQEKVLWWNRDFPKGDKPAPQAALAISQDRMRDRASSDAQRTQAQESRRAEAPPASPAPAPAARNAAPSAGRLNQPLASADAASVGQAARRDAETTASIRLQRWEPDAPHAVRMRNAAKADLYRVYLEQRANHPASTAFFLDAADVFFDKGEPALAIRGLSNLAEMDLENRHILRVLGHRLLQANRPQLAAVVFRQVLALSPEEPQSYRDLGLALAATGELQKAVDLLNEVVIRPWHGRFPEVELIALAELNALVATAGKALDTSRIDPRLLVNLPLDLRVILTWDADNTDIDLWVTDPNGDKAYYGNRLTWQGGRMSLDFTGGYGPEEFSLKRAKPGKYKVEAQYYGDRRQSVTGPTTLQVKLTTKFGLPGQKDQSVTMRLKDRSETVFVGEFEVR